MQQKTTITILLNTMKILKYLQFETEAMSNEVFVNTIRLASIMNELMLFTDYQITSKLITNSNMIILLQERTT